MFNFTCSFLWVWNLVSYIREQHRLKTLVNKLLSRFSGAKTEEVTGGWENCW